MFRPLLTLQIGAAHLALLVSSGTAQFQAHAEHHGAFHSPVNRLNEGSSFELGTVDPAACYTFCDGFSVQRRMWVSAYPDEDAFIDGYRAATFDSSAGAVHGLRALRIDNPNGDWVAVHFQPVLIAVGQGGTYTFSAWFKAGHLQTVGQVKMTIRNFLNLGDKQDSPQVSIGDTWTRIEVSKYLAQGSWYEFYITLGSYTVPATTGAGTLWLDAVQLEQGAPASAFLYHTQAQELCAFTTDGVQPRAGNLYTSDDAALRLVVQVHEETPLPATPGAQHHLRWRILNRDALQVVSGSAPLAPSPSGFQELELLDVMAALDATLGPGWRGWYRVELDLTTASGVNVDHEEVVFTRHEATPFQQGLFVPQSPFGTHLPGSQGSSEAGAVVGINQRLSGYWRLASSIGARWSRLTSFAWPYCNPAAGVFQWNGPIVTLGERFGLLPMANTQGIPAWVSTTTSAGGKSIPDAAGWLEYESYLAAAFHAFDGRISVWEIENEPDHPYHPSHYDPIDYNEFVMRAEVESHDPALAHPVALAGPAGSSFVAEWNGQTWLQDLLVGFPAAYAALEHVTQHFYLPPVTDLGTPGMEYHLQGYPELVPALPPHSLENNIDLVHDAIAAASGGDPGGRPYWIKELGWFTVRNATDVAHRHDAGGLTNFPGMSGRIDLTRHIGEWLVRYHVIALARGVDRLIQFTLDHAPGIASGSSFGILDHDLTGTMGLTAYAAMTARLGAVPLYLREIQSQELPLAAASSTVRAHVFQRSDGGTSVVQLRPPGGGGAAVASGGALGASGKAPASGKDRVAGPAVAVLWDWDPVNPTARLLGIGIAPGSQVLGHDLEGNVLDLGAAAPFDLDLGGSPVYLTSAGRMSAAGLVSALDVVPPAKPPQPTATVHSAGYTALTWSTAAAEYDVAGWNVYREDSPGVWSQAAWVAGRTSGSWTDPHSSTCSYKVCAVEAVTGREGPLSDTATCIVEP